MVKVMSVQCDITVQSTIQTMFAYIKEEIRHLDVLIRNAGGPSTGTGIKIGEGQSADWWADIDFSLKGTYLTIHHYISTFSPNPIGTIIALTSNSGFILPLQQSAYALSKRFISSMIEVVHNEHPSLRAFALSPGMVPTSSMPEAFRAYALDTPELVGAMCVYLANGRAEYARGGFVSVNWDVEEMEQNKDEIKEKGLLKCCLVRAELGAGGHAFRKE